MSNKNYVTLINDYKNNFEQKLDFFIKFPFQNKKIIGFIDKSDLYFVEKNSCILFENKYCVAVKFDKESDLEKLVSLFSNGELRMARLIILDYKNDLKELCLSLINLKPSNTLKKIDDYLMQNFYIYYYSENFGESEILYISENLYSQVEYIMP